MLHLTHSLLFPTLQRFGETTFKSHSDSNKSTDLYTLNWDEIDKIKRERFLVWYKEYGRKDLCGEKMLGTLPEEYDEKVKKLIFALPTSYLEEIHKNSRTAQTEWATRYPFDTIIREMCLTPAIAHVYVAFHLLKDCIYDPVTNYFSRDPDRDIMTQALLYKFWAEQTGRGCVKDHSYFDKITWILKKGINPSFRDVSYIDRVQKFVAAINKYEEELEKFYATNFVEPEGQSAIEEPLITVAASSDEPMED